MNLGPHAAFIVGAYTVAAAIIVGMIAWVWFDYRRQLRLLSDLEAHGITRRSHQVMEEKKSA
jgi:heme exporter protein D